jgi:hypothetical protein
LFCEVLKIAISYTSRTLSLTQYRALPRLHVMSFLISVVDSLHHVVQWLDSFINLYSKVLLFISLQQVMLIAIYLINRFVYLFFCSQMHYRTIINVESTLPFLSPSSKFIQVRLPCCRVYILLSVLLNIFGSSSLALGKSFI